MARRAREQADGDDKGYRAAPVPPRRPLAPPGSPLGPLGPSRVPFRLPGGAHWHYGGPRSQLAVSLRAACADPTLVHMHPLWRFSTSPGGPVRRYAAPAMDYSQQHIRPTGPSEATWSQNLAMLCRREIDAGRLVRVALPGASQPILVEDAYDWARMLVIVDPQGRSYHAAHPAGVVVLCDPVAPPAPGEKPYWMLVDGGDDVPNDVH